MDELDEALAISMTGPRAEELLAACRRRVAAWGLAMPDVPPLLIDFQLGDVRDCGLIEFWIANELKSGYCGKFLFVFDGQTCPRHRHGIKHETFYAVRGRARLDGDDGSRVLGPGDVAAVPPGTWHSFTGQGDCLLLEISMVCEINDNEFADPRVPYGCNHIPESEQ